ncbi:MAG TPA: hypothetical protein VNN72_27715 [Polyangiaceae bacterium]|nr:hypothetical protein [Polyangiaceae bacterium]
MMRPKSTLKWLVFASLLAAACDGVLGIDDWTPRKAAVSGCTLNTDCPADLVCVFAQCSIACRNDRDCDSPGRCLSLDNGTSGCVSPEVVDCTSMACLGGTECRNGECRTPCSLGCRTDQRCEGTVCVGVDESPAGGTGGTNAAGGKGGNGTSPGTGGGSEAGAGATIKGEAGETAGGADGGGTTGGGTGPGDGGSSGKGGSGGTTADPCVGVACDDPPDSECPEEDTLRTYKLVGDCSDGECSYGHMDTPCDFGCANGACQPDPCIGVTCDAPPANTCENSGSLLAYDPIGSCMDGDCSYTSRGIPCTCTNDTCTTDPCASVTCNTPQPPTCFDPDTQRVFKSTGTCSNGSCSYGYDDNPCDFGCSGGACNADPCNGVTCNDPPNPGCPMPGTLREFEALGSCDNGTCTYDHTDTFCTDACVTSPSPHCQCDPGYSGTGIGSNGCMDDNECTLNTDDCDNSPAALCVNNMGSFDCSCPMPYTGTGHGTGGCSCPTEPRCDSSSEQNGSYCSNSTTRITCSNDNGCQSAAQTVCTNLAAEKCVDAYPNSKCEVTAGFPTDGGGQSNLDNTTLFAVPFTLTQPLTLTRMGLIAKAAASGVRMAVYQADGSGALGTYKASATNVTVANGRNEYVITDPPSTSPVTLAAGNYWIAVAVQVTTAIAQGASGACRYNVSWDPWDRSFPSGTLSTTSMTLARLNLYVVGKP